MPGSCREAGADPAQGEDRNPECRAGAVPAAATAGSGLGAAGPLRSERDPSCPVSERTRAGSVVLDVCLDSGDLGSLEGIEAVQRRGAASMRLAAGPLPST